MADIFISYARENAARVEGLASALETAGYSAWWDRNLTSGARYLKETEAELNAAKAVLVIWSKVSVDSHWVADEAAVGRDENRLAAISFDGSMPPLGFRQFQVTDFSHWKGGADEAPFRSLVSALARLAPHGEGGAAPATAKPSRLLADKNRVLILGAAALAVVVLVAAVSLFALNQGTAPPQSQRVAFFGFTATSDDPAVKTMADAATDETFHGMGVMRLGIVAPAETLNTPPEKRLGRAKELGAQYALSGDVRRDGDAIGITLHLEDVPSRVTLWDEPSIRGGLSDTTSLPVQAAAKAASLVACLARFRASLPRDEQALLPVMARVCSQIRAITVDSAWDMRELARKTPGSATIQADTAYRLAALTASNSALPMARPALIIEAEEALKRAEDLDPKLVAVINARAYVAVAKNGRPLEQLAILEEGLARVNADEDILSYASLNFLYGSFLTSAGRNRAAAPYMNEAMAADPYFAAAFGRGGRLLAVIGRGKEADKLFSDALARLPDAFLWQVWMYSALFLDVSDSDQVLARVGPVNIKPDTVECWRRMRDVLALSAKDPAKRRADGRVLVADCYDGGKINISLGGTSMFAALGDMDQAFAFASRYGMTTSAGSSGNAELFWPAARALRANDGFMELVKERGLWEYWVKTNTRPDVCETEPAPFCRALAAALSTK